MKPYNGKMKDTGGRGFQITWNAPTALKVYDFSTETFAQRYEVWYCSRGKKGTKFFWRCYIVKQKHTPINQCRDPHIIEYLSEFRKLDFEAEFLPMVEASSLRSMLWPDPDIPGDEGGPYAYLIPKYFPERSDHAAKNQDT